MIARWIDSINWGDFPSFLAAIVATVALLLSIKSRRDAGRSAVASEKAADAAVRSASTAEEMLNLAQAEAERYEYPWLLTGTPQKINSLINNDKPAVYNVQLEGNISIVSSRDLSIVEGGGRIEIVNEGYGFGSKDTGVLVKWQRTPKSDSTVYSHTYQFPG